MLRLYKPAKNKLMAIVANRYLVHAVMVMIATVSIISGTQANHVRAESFGETSLLYGMVSGEQLEIIEERAATTPPVELVGGTYQNFGTLSPLAYGQANTAPDSSVTFVGGHVIALPTVSESPSRAARKDSQSYVIQSGDTLSSIATRFDLAIDTILWANNLNIRSVLQPGETLTILPVDGVSHAVKNGDTISSLARKYDVDQETILAYNGLSEEDVLSIGDELLVPGGEVKVATSPSSSAISRIFSTPAPTSVGSAVTVSTSGAGKMIWPTDLSYITQYFNWRHSGLDIDCGYTNDNYAATAGYISYAGWRGGYGYLVEINHGNGLITRYGHHASLYVTTGQYVGAGQALGRCGTTGNSSGTHLHFEVIVNGATRNPLEYIR